MIDLLLAAAIAVASSSPAPRTLAGLTLGTTLANAASEHPGAEESRDPNGSWHSWKWTRPEGGVVSVWTDSGERITKIDFIVVAGERGSVDLPCARSFDVEGSHVNLGFAVDPKDCVLRQGSMSTYDLPDASIFEARFDSPDVGDFGLREALWYRP